MDNEHVFKILCENCDTLIHQRAMQVCLVSNREIKLFSSDLITNEVTFTNEIRKFEHCECQIRDTLCRKCSHIVGYHVIYPCENCLNGNNNSHYWMFNRVKSEKFDELLWLNLPSIVKFNKLPVVPITELEDYQICRICLEIIEDAVIIKCGHTFCKVCITRQIDLRKKCPLDNQQIIHFDLIPNYFAQSDINNILIRCMYGCKMQGNQWIISQDEHCWERHLHEMNCPYKDK